MIRNQYKLLFKCRNRLKLRFLVYGFESFYCNLTELCVHLFEIILSVCMSVCLSCSFLSIFPSKFAIFLHRTTLPRFKGQLSLSLLRRTNYSKKIYTPTYHENYGIDSTHITQKYTHLHTR